MIKVHFTIINTNHIIIDCKINGINGKFILDTGASNSCIDLLSADKFDLSYKKFKEKTSSASNIIKETFHSKQNTLEIAKLKKTNFEFILFDMKHINDSLNEKEIHSIDGIIGGDFLAEHNAVINYKNHFDWKFLPYSLKIRSFEKKLRF